MNDRREDRGCERDHDREKHRSIVSPSARGQGLGAWIVEGLLDLARPDDAGVQGLAPFRGHGAVGDFVSERVLEGVLGVPPGKETAEKRRGFLSWTTLGFEDKDRLSSNLETKNATKSRWWLQRDSNPCFSLERAATWSATTRTYARVATGGCHGAFE